MNIIIPTVNGDFERLEIHEGFDLEKDRNTLLLDDGTYIELLKQPDGFIERQWKADSYFGIIKHFYTNGNIKFKGVVFNSGEFLAGRCYVFNPEGQMTQQTNADEGYEYSFQQLYEYLIKKEIRLTPGVIQPYTGYHTMIYKKERKNKPVWLVKWLKEPLLIEKLFIDGKKGKLLKTEYIEREEP